ncbi:MAG: hypothetical protein GYA55_00145 [SAR324 cluster bacterium]|uniref:Uncharacterized protein n=1 Tax=SAR324 cluster bacterium TaxID=2024889 RepID=A0A7X9FPQ8_9DELT|nr:hypothetical protein [SAR324 cluster bacterium]
MDKALLKQSIDDWNISYRMDRKNLTPRHMTAKPSLKMALALVGVRRCGKPFNAIEMSREFSQEQVLY